MSHPVHCLPLPSLSTCRALPSRRCLPGLIALAPDGSTRRPVGGRAEFGSQIVPKQSRPEFRSEWPIPLMTLRWHCGCLTRARTAAAAPMLHPQARASCCPALLVCRRSFRSSLPPPHTSPTTCRPGYPAAHGAPLHQDGVHRRRRLPQGKRHAVHPRIRPGLEDRGERKSSPPRAAVCS